MTLPTDKYTSGDYLKNNPTWDREDSAWKAAHVVGMLSEIHEAPRTICEVGCGAGGVLEALKRSFPDVDMFGFDISPDLLQFWKERNLAGISFKTGDFFHLNKRNYDVILLLDVVEHLENPHDFICRLGAFANHFIFHIPLDLCAVTVLRESPLLHVREKAGHINYFTKNLALSLLKECGYEIIRWTYTGATVN